MEKVSHTPCFTRLWKHEKVGENIVLWYASAEPLGYRIELSHTAVGQTIDALQDTSDQIDGGPVRTLTLLAHKPAATPDSKGILIRTQEWGTIAVEMPQEALIQLRQGLATIELLPEATTKQ